MTEQQFEKGSELFYELKGVKRLINDISEIPNDDLLIVTIPNPYHISQVVSDDIKNIRLEKSGIIKAQILECLNLHVIRIQAELDLI